MNTQKTNLKTGCTFASYRWYKPILIGLLTAVFYVVFELIINSAVLIFNSNEMESLLDSGANYDSIDVFSASGVLINMGGVAALLPALFFAVLIVRERTFSSYSSSRGGWNKYLFFKSLAIAAAVCVSFFIIGNISDGDPYSIKSYLFLYSRIRIGKYYLRHRCFINGDFCRYGCYICSYSDNSRKQKGMVLLFKEMIHKKSFVTFAALKEINIYVNIMKYCFLYYGRNQVSKSFRLSNGTKMSMKRIM